MKDILKTIVGSRAHGTFLPESDYDYRGVFIVDAEDFISPFRNVKNNHWLEGEEDNTSYELSHFVKLCTHGNPSALELLVAPVVDITTEGERLREMLPKFLSKRRVFDAFMGYSKSQEKKFREDHLGRKWKYAEAHLRTQYQLLHLLKTGELKIGWEGGVLEELRKTKRGQRRMIDVFDRILQLEDMCREEYDKCTFLPAEPDIPAIEKFLFDIYLNDTFTGHVDVNGEKVFENDIVEADLPYRNIHRVLWNSRTGRFELRDIEGRGRRGSLGYRKMKLRRDLMPK